MDKQQIYLITRNGYGIEVTISEDNLKTLQDRVIKNSDPVTTLEVN